MYGPLWRLLPGRWPAKVLASLVLVVGVVLVCFLWLFPAIAPLMPFNDNTIQSGPQTPGPQTPGPQSPRPTSTAP